MVTVSAYEAESHLSSLLDRVAHGEEIVITRQDVPIAALVPVDTSTVDGRRQAIARIKRRRIGCHLGEDIKSLIAEGRM